MGIEHDSDITKRAEAIEIEVLVAGGLESVVQQMMDIFPDHSSEAIQSLLEVAATTYMPKIAEFVDEYRAYQQPQFRISQKTDPNT